MDNTNTPTVFEAHAERYEQAYNAHVRKWIIVNPRPKEPTASSLITWHHWVVGLILIASAIVSASHTLPVVLGEIDKIDNVDISDPSAIDYILAVATFIMIEVTAIYFAYSHITNSHNGIDIPDITQPLKVGVMFTVGAMFAINIYGVLSVTGLIETVSFIWKALGIGIYLWVACIPPVNAYLCGDVLAINVIQLKAQNEVYYNDYLDDMESWRTKLENSWNAKKKDYGVSIKVSVPSIPQTDSPHQLSMSMSNQTDIRQTGAGFKRSSSAIDNARQWLLDNPERVHESARNLAKDVPNAGKDSINTARNQLKEEGLI